MKKLIAITITALSLGSSAFAGYGTVFINGEAYEVYENGNNTQVYGPNGYNAQGYRFGNYENWNVNPGRR